MPFVNKTTGKIVNYNNYDDQHQMINVAEKTVTIGDIGKIETGDILSQAIKFEVPRFYDNIDLKDMDFYIIYRNKGGVFKADAINVAYDTDLIRFDWLLDEDATLYPGKLEASIQLVGVNEKNETYAIKTDTFSVDVLDSLNEYGEEGIYVSWAKTIETVVENLFQTVSSSNSTFVGTTAQYTAAIANGDIKAGTVIILTDV